MRTRCLFNISNAWGGGGGGVCSEECKIERISLRGRTFI